MHEYVFVISGVCAYTCIGWLEGAVGMATETLRAALAQCPGEWNATNPHTDSTC